MTNLEKWMEEVKKRYERREPFDYEDLPKALRIIERIRETLTEIRNLKAKDHPELFYSLDPMNHPSTLAYECLEEIEEELK